MNRFRRIVLKHFWWLGMIVAGSLLAAHSLGVRVITVDTTSLFLVGFLLLCPWLAALKRIKIGDFEAEIDPAEVKRLTADLSKALPELNQEPTPMPLGASAAGEAVRQLAVSDPVLALAKLRIELEQTLRRLHARTSQSASSPRNVALGRIIQDLAAHQALPQDLAAAIRDVLTICNRAIHGEEIRTQDALAVAETGGELLEGLEQLAREYAATHPQAREIINKADVEAYERAYYRLTTVIPYVDNPQRLTYVLSHDELGEFFDGYSEFGEYVVGIERLPNKDPA
jgi:Domain of unknown function (DUF4145)